MTVVSYKEAVEWAKNWKAPECTDPECICNKPYYKKEVKKDDRAN